MFLLLHDIAFSSASLSSCLPPLCCLASELWTSRDCVLILGLEWRERERAWMRKASLPAAPHYWKIYSSCTLSHVCSQSGSFVGSYPSLVIKIYINMGLTYCMRKCLLRRVFSGQQHLTQGLGIPRGRRGLRSVNVPAPETIWQHLICVPRGARPAVLPVARSQSGQQLTLCLCLSTRAGTQFLKLCSVLYYIYTICIEIIFKTVTKLTFWRKNIFCMWNNKDIQRGAEVPNHT